MARNRRPRRRRNRSQTEGDAKPANGEARSQNSERSGDRSNNTASSEGEPEDKSARGFLKISNEGFGFLRDPKNSMAADRNDVFVPARMIERYRLRPGVEIIGSCNRRRNGRRPLDQIESVDGMDPARAGRLPQFRQIVSEDPFLRVKLEMPDNDLTLRAIDLVTPLGFGQRALVVAPPRTGKTVILQKLAKAIIHNHPDVKVIVVLVDERPEEVTDFRRNCEGAEVLASSLDKDGSVHVALCEMLLERTRRQVEQGEHVVCLFDSLTRMARAFNNERGRSGRTLSGGLDATAMQIPREIFGAARNTEEGSLTMIATALVDTGSRMDQVIFEEYKGTGNLELVLSRDLSDHRIFPAINIRESGTRKEEKLRTPDELLRVNMLRRTMLRSRPREAMQALLAQLKKTSCNAEFLSQIPV